jgi:hypothetical protein
MMLAANGARLWENISASRRESFEATCNLYLRFLPVILTCIATKTTGKTVLDTA